ncbi:MAG: glycosyltransferase [Deltaproteobacteria bacterium]|nr:glycosyltransferase [Deltaproteobacteria bacterium]
MSPFLLELLGDIHWMFVSVGIISSFMFLGLALWARGRSQVRGDEPLPPVTILKPFDGVDAGLADNFWSYVEADYAAPREVLFCTARENVEGIAVVEELLERLAREPQEGVTARLLLPPEGEAPWITRKVWHMARGLAAASHAIVVNGDSGTRLTDDTLPALVRALVRDAKRGAVWAPYTVAEGSSLGARLTRVAWTATSTNFLVIEGTNRILGLRSMLAGGLFAARKEALDQLDGLRECDGYLTEDMEVGARIQANGWTVGPSPEPVIRYLEGLDFDGFFARQLRWNTIIWRFRNLLVYPYPLTMCGLAIAPSTFVAASLAFPDRVVEYALALAALFLVRSLYALVLSSIVNRRLAPLDTVVLLPLVDLVYLITWIRGPFVKTIRWRDTVLRVGPGGKVTPL